MVVGLAWLAAGCGSTDSDGSGTGGAGGSGGGGSAGTSGTCANLMQEYAAALSEAKVCDTSINTLLCTAKTSDQLLCGCPTFYNPANKDAVNKLATVSQQAQAASCQVPCPKIACADPQSASCVASGSGTVGVCTDTVN